ncbi:DsbA family protein [Kocuria sp. p3-SID1433]|uniref:DsbA family protein n=1 Tax=Kocuria TaxID=57493 RepID=UPI0021A82F67|nr:MULTISPECIES: DsbA family protein [unclassified Kocuria]MCT1602819.1 DsbA family protein [Kocuria sp. p3-SID1428]MCT2180796.1 DsbA family protein [Kocuria sp. p3-SID1433]
MSTTSPTSGQGKSPTAKVAVWVVLAAVVIAAVIAFVAARVGSTAAAPEDAGQVVRENSQVLSQAPNEQAVLVEFLDYECESCRAAYPFIEELRVDHADTVTFVHRYFPLPGHRNSMNAAVAVEAAAQQDQYEAMYQRMYETQAQWGESAEDKSAVFRGFAEDMGLDMAAFDAAVADPATQERVELDVADGEALGVGGTPTFYLDGEVLNPESLEEFRAEVEAAAAD